MKMTTMINKTYMNIKQMQKLFFFICVVGLAKIARPPSKDKFYYGVINVMLIHG